MSGPGLFSCMDLADCPPPVEVESAHEHCSLVLLAADEALFLHAKILVPVPEFGAWAVSYTHLTLPTIYSV